MKTAKQILCKEWDCEERDLSAEVVLNSDISKMESAINNARREAIMACVDLSNPPDGVHEGGTSLMLLRKSMFDLIKDLK